MIPHSHQRRANEEQQMVISEELGKQPHDAITNFEPSLVVVIGILAVVFFLTILLLLYFKFCHPNNSTSPAAIANQQEENTQSGLDKKSIQSLPFFQFGALRGSKQGLECAVCLSKYEEAEILRLLPKCRHAFHVDCVDQWLSRHSNCPLCRSQVVAVDSPMILARCISNQEDAEDSISNGDESRSASIDNDGVEVFVEREDEESGDQNNRVIRRSCSKFSIGSSFRRLFGGGSRERVLHKHNHKIVFSDVVFKNRWSNVSSSDLMFLQSEMMISESELEVEWRKRNSNASASSQTRALLNTGGESAVGEGRRSVSEITMYSRWKEDGEREEEGERKRKFWFPIARKTVEWFANASKEQQTPIHQRDHLNVV